MIKPIRWVALALAVVLGALSVAGHGAMQREVVRVGVTSSLSGPLAELGRDQLLGVQMWADDLNARGALLGRRVEIVSYDDASDPLQVQDLYERLITEDQVDLLLGPYSSDLTLVAARVAESHDFPMVALGAAASKIWDQGFRNIFQIDAQAPDYMDPVLELAESEGFTRVALIYQATEFPQEVAAGAKVEMAKHGMELVFEESYPLDATDFDGVAFRLQAADPQVVLAGTFFEDGVALAKAIRRTGFQPSILAMTVAPARREFGDTLQEDSSGIMGVVAWMRSGKVPMAYDFSFRYKEKFGVNAAVHAAYGYAGGQVLEAAVRLAGTFEHDAVREQLRTMVFRSLLGDYRVDESGRQLAKRTFVLQWQGPFRLLVQPADIRDAPAQFPGREPTAAR